MWVQRLLLFVYLVPQFFCSCYQEKEYASSVLEGFELTATYASTYFDKVSSDFIAPAPTGTAASASAATSINCAQYGAFSPGCLLLGKS